METLIIQCDYCLNQLEGAFKSKTLKVTSRGNDRLRISHFCNEDCLVDYIKRTGFKTKKPRETL